MKKTYLILVSALTLFGTISTTGAATSVTIDPTGNYVTDPGQIITFNAVFNADDNGDIFEGTTLQFGYDAAELDFLSYSNPLGWPEFFGPAQDVTVGTGTYIINFNTNYNFGASPMPVAANASLIMGTFTFQTLGTLPKDGLPDFWFVDTVTYNGLYNDGIVSYKDSATGDVINKWTSELATSQGADVSAVPIPAAAWLLGSGLLGLLGLRRRSA